MVESDNKRRLFDRWAPFYDCPFTSVLYQSVHEVVLADIDLADGAEILDLGCGTGRFLDRLGRKFPNVRRVGVDLSEVMLRSARRSFREGRQGDRRRPIFVQGNADALPFGGDRFDVVFCAFSFLHYPHPERVFGEIARVLKPGGRFIWIDGQPGLGVERSEILFTPGGIQLYGQSARDALATTAGLRSGDYRSLLGAILVSEFIKG